MLAVNGDIFNVYGCIWRSFLWFNTVAVRSFCVLVGAKDRLGL